MTSLEDSVRGYILAVDDDRPILNMMEMVINSFGYRITTAENGIDAIAAYNRMIEENGLWDKSPIANHLKQ